MGEFKKAGQLHFEETEPAVQRRLNNFPHGPMAGVLLVLALIIRFGVPLVVHTNEVLGPDARNLLTIVTVVGVVFWMWGCVHLAMRFRLHPLWSLWGLLFLVGLCVIFWASTQVTKWERQPLHARDKRGRPVSEDPY